MNSLDHVLKDAFKASKSVSRRMLTAVAFQWVCRVTTMCSVLILAVLLYTVLSKGLGHLSWSFLTSSPHPDPARAGIWPALMGTFWTCAACGVLTLPIGIGTAIFLEELRPKNRMMRWLHAVVQLNIANLAGVPSIVYGILGYTVFRTFAATLSIWFDGNHVVGVLGLFRVRLAKLPLYEDNVLVGALTLTLVILPTVIAASQEALRSVPSSIRVASLALGATRWQTIWRQVIPAALPGISTGVILSTSRAIGEAAPLIMLGALTYTSMCPGNIDSPVKLLTRPGQVLHAPLDQFTAMPIEIYDWSKHPEPQFTAVAASGIVVLLVVLLAINSVAMIVRHYASRRMKW